MYYFLHKKINLTYKYKTPKTFDELRQWQCFVLGLKTPRTVDECYKITNHTCSSKEFIYSSLKLNKRKYSKMLTFNNFFTRKNKLDANILKRTKYKTATNLLRPVHTVRFFLLRLRFLPLQQMGYTGLNGSVHTKGLWQHHQLLCKPLWAKINRSHKSHSVNEPLIQTLILVDLS